MPSRCWTRTPKPAGSWSRRSRPCHRPSTGPQTTRLVRRCRVSAWSFLWLVQAPPVIPELWLGAAVQCRQAGKPVAIDTNYRRYEDAPRSLPKIALPSCRSQKVALPVSPEQPLPRARPRPEPEARAASPRGATATASSARPTRRSGRRTARLRGRAREQVAGRSDVAAFLWPYLRDPERCALPHDMDALARAGAADLPVSDSLGEPTINRAKAGWSRAVYPRRSGSPVSESRRGALPTRSSY